MIEYVIFFISCFLGAIITTFFFDDKDFWDIKTTKDEEKSIKELDE